MMQSLDSTKEPMTTNLRTPSPGVYASVKCKSTENPPLVNRGHEQLKAPKPRGAWGSANDSQRTFLTSLNFEFVKVQDTEREASHSAKPINNWAHADQYIGCIQKICQIATGETLSQKQALDVQNCCGGLVTNLRSKGSIATLKSLLVNCHRHALPSLDSHDLNSSLTACVVYLKYLNSVAGSTSKPDDVHRRFAQITDTVGAPRRKQ